MIDAAAAGEEAVIARGKRAVVKRVPVRQKSFKFGVLKGQLMGPGPDFFQPLSEDDLVLWEGGA
ncbi:MAG: type II toxin-antitoxin system prevent-host-death family antitoxin [Alphaproteobacteria bacterium]|nr:type II toxin-antitoxin system prevent-host-death family antitoxin [Alphaproteobacteria bacterium]